MTSARDHASRADAHVELTGLKTLSCGCIVGGYRSSTMGLRLLALEAKGPYCVEAGHQLDRVVWAPEDADAA